MKNVLAATVHEYYYMRASNCFSEVVNLQKTTSIHNKYTTPREQPLVVYMEEREQSIDRYKDMEGQYRSRGNSLLVYSDDSAHWGSRRSDSSYWGQIQAPLCGIRVSQKKKKSQSVANIKVCSDKERKSKPKEKNQRYADFTI
jgi:hypothetical protein